MRPFPWGADEGVLLTDRKFGGADVFATSYTLSQGIRKFGEKVGKFDLIICGLQTTDGDTAQVGPEVSEQLDIPCVCNVKSVKEADGDGLAEAYLGRKFPDNQADAYLLLKFDGNTMEEIASYYDDTAQICLEQGAIDILISDTDERSIPVWKSRGAFQGGL